MKRALLDLGKLEVTAKEEPLICGEEEEEEEKDDDAIWTKFAPDLPALIDDRDPGPSSLGAPLSAHVRDEFLPISLDEVDQNEESIADVDQVIHKLQDNLVSIIKNPRMHSLIRLPCFCHLLQVIFSQNCLKIMTLARKISAP